MGKDPHELLMQITIIRVNTIHNTDNRYRQRAIIGYLSSIPIPEFKTLEGKGFTIFAFPDVSDRSLIHSRDSRPVAYHTLCITYFPAGVN